MMKFTFLILAIVMIKSVSKVSSEDCNFLKQERCGDVCIGKIDFCFCGQQIIRPDSDFSYCCVPPKSNGTSCEIRTGQYNSGGIDLHEVVYGYCPTGEVKPMDISCGGECYNDIKTSPFIGSKSHFKCNSSNYCVGTSGICKG